ncbi:MAG: hypothetical protein KC766_04830 [Myxococcales bacterium]|nr:hypothetical protein [Myxococcales bacterium]
MRSTAAIARGKPSRARLERPLRRSGVLLALLCLGGCSLVGADVDELFGGATCEGDCEDAGADSTTDARSCDPIKPPSRPSGMDSGGPERSYVLRDTLIDQSLDRWRTLGFDLDDRCSLPPDPDVECLPPAGTTPETDGERGIDNAFGHRVASTLVGLDANLEKRIRKDQEAGRGGILVNIQGYNGERDDPSVDVFIAQTIYAVPHGENGKSQPHWDGRDRFYCEDSAFDGSPDAPLVRNDNAYVRDGWLVVRLPDRADITFNIDDGAVNFRFISASIVGRFSEDGRFLEDVVLSGRWALSDIALAADQLGICEGTVERTFLDNSLASIADVRGTPGTGGPNALCDAVSASLGFRGYRGFFEGLAVTEDVPTGCP